jgi:hypothetical protein
LDSGWASRLSWYVTPIAMARNIEEVYLKVQLILLSPGNDNKKRTIGRLLRVGIMNPSCETEHEGDVGNDRPQLEIGRRN